ncbi:MAG: hypothetical protein MK095_07210 [Phycisphaerales bacterium]|nr:hypothetical protein [Phycisphaerales bacterium]
MATSPTVLERLDALESRLARRDAQVRRHRMLTGSLLAIIGIGILAAADYTRFQHIQMSKLEIVDEQGNVVIGLSANSGGGQLDVWNAASRNVIRLSANDHGGDVAVWNNAGQSIVGAWASPEGGVMATWNSQGKRATRLDSAQGRGRFSLHAGTPQQAVELRATEDGGALTTYYDTGKPSLHMHPRGSGMSLAFAAEGDNTTAPRFEMGIDDQQSMIAMTESSGSLSLTSNPNDGGPAIDVLNQQGESTVHAGLRSTGAGQLKISAANGETVGMFRADQDGNGRLDLGDAKGNMLMTFQALQDKGPTLAFLSSWGKTMAVLAGTSEGGVLNLSNRNGVPVVTTGIARDRRGGTMSIQNERGMNIINAGSTAAGAGQIRLHGPDGELREALPAGR